MDENNNKMSSGNGEAEKKKAEDLTPDWELLSMSMTASVSDLKSALAAAEGEGGGGEGGVSEATMHSQYFGQVMASVLPPAAPPGEIFPQQAEQPGKQSDPEGTKENHPSLDAVGEAEAQLRREIEQQILAAALGEEGYKSPEVASAVGLASPTKTSRPEVEEVKEVEGVVKAEVMAATVVISSPRKSKVRSGEWMKRRLQVITKKVNKSSTMWSIALVAAVTGLFIIGKRWYYDSFKSLDLSLDSYSSDEKLSEIAREIAEVNQAAAGESASAVVAAPEGVESQASSGGFFGSLRDFW